MIIEGIMKGLAIWLYNLLLEIVEFIADALLDVFNMDLAYFESNVPVTNEIVTIIMGAGWALLIGNLTFQAIKSMMSGIGFEGEDPKMLFTRTFIFSFLLLASRQICTIGLNMTSTLNTLLQTPSAVNIGLPELDVFSISGSWLLVIIIGVILMFQLVRFFFEMAERYVVLVILTLFAPLAFGVGGSKNTEDIFKGWARMYASACLMMVFNTTFLKLLLSAMSNMPAGTGSTASLLPWTLLVVGLAKVARKIDDIVARIGLNSARTGDKLGAGGIMYPIMVMRNLSGIVGKTIGGAAKTASNAPKSGTRGSGTPKPPTAPPAPASANGGNNPPNSPSGSSGSAAPQPPSGSASGGAPYPEADSSSKPTRPPVGVRGDINSRSRGTAPSSGEQDNNIGGGITRSGAAGRSSADGFRRYGESPQSDGKAGDNAGQRSGGTKTNDSELGNSRTNSRTQPPLSTGTRTPGVSAAQNSVPDHKASQRNGQSGRKVNIDIYRDDDPRARSSQARPPSSAGARPHVAQSGAAGHSAAQSTGTASAGKVPQANTRPAATSSAQRSSQDNKEQSGTAKPQIPSTPINAASPRGGRISGGITNPSDTHRAPSKTAPTVQAAAASVNSSVQSNTAQSQHTKSASAHIKSSAATTEASRVLSSESRRTPPSAAASTPVSPDTQRTPKPNRYRIASRSVQEQKSIGGNQLGSQRTPGQTQYNRDGRSINERGSKDNPPNSMHRDSTISRTSKRRESSRKEVIPYEQRTE